MSAEWQFTIKPGTSERDTNLARDFWQSELDGKRKLRFDYTSQVVAAKYGITEYELRKIQQAVMTVRAPDSICRQCKRGLTWKALSCRSRADLQSYVDEWKESACNECRAAREAEHEAECAKREKQRQVEMAARRANLRQRYGERALKDCPNCDGLLIIRKGRNGGMFVGCSEYPDCEFTMPIPKPVEVTPEDLAQIAEIKKAFADAPKCAECGAPMKKFNGKYGPFLGCTNYPRCRVTMTLTAAPPKLPAPSLESFEEIERKKMQAELDKLAPQN
jgi:ssDNA-binding Zn-finger/Zn-ribbon topoisomerase 1